MNSNLDNPMTIRAADAYARSEKPIPESCWRQARDLVLGDMDTFSDWLAGEGYGSMAWQHMHVLLTTNSASAMSVAVDYLVEQYLTDQAGYVAAEAQALANEESA